VIEVPGIADDTERRSLADRPLPELRRVRLADDDRARLLDLSDQLAVGVLDLEVAGASERGRLAGQIDVVFDRDRNAEQRRLLTRGATPVGLLRLGERRFRTDAAKRVDAALGGLDPT